MALVPLLDNDADRRVAVVEVAFRNGMWWSMPQWMSEPILARMRDGDEGVSFVWDWEDTRIGSFRLDDQETRISRYVINFTTMTQTNSDNQRTRSIRIAYVSADAQVARFTGELQ